MPARRRLGDFIAPGSGWITDRQLPVLLSPEPRSVLQARWIRCPRFWLDSSLAITRPPLSRLVNSATTVARVVRSQEESSSTSRVSSTTNPLHTATTAFYPRVERNKLLSLHYDFVHGGLCVVRTLYMHACTLRKVIRCHLHPFPMVNEI